MILTAPAANAARSEYQIKSECEQGGGTYTTQVAPDGRRYSSCCYPHDYVTGGGMHCEFYMDGAWQPTPPMNQNPPPPPSPISLTPAPGAIPPVQPPVTAQ
jgi:hypothetical protein